MCSLTLHEATNEQSFMAAGISQGIEVGIQARVVVETSGLKWKDSTLSLGASA